MPWRKLKKSREIHAKIQQKSTSNQCSLRQSRNAKSYCQYQRKGGANLAIIEVRFFKGGYSFIRQSVNTPAKVEVFKFNNGYWGTFACQFNHLWHYNRGAKQEALKEALFKFDSINFSIIPERIQETIKRANASGIISVTEDSDIVVRAEIAHNGEFVYDITITAKIQHVR